jgi:hypothetical protein
MTIIKFHRKLDFFEKKEKGKNSNKVEDRTIKPWLPDCEMMPILVTVNHLIAVSSPARGASYFGGKLTKANSSR